MGLPRVLPIRDNRQRAFDYLVRFSRSARVEDLRKSRVAKEVAMLLASNQHTEPMKRYAETYLAASALGGFNLATAADRMIAGDSANAWQDAMEALSLGFLASELQKHLREQTPLSYRNRADDYYTLAFHGVLAGLRLWPQADCLCRYLMNLWLGRGIDQQLLDQEDYLSFYWFLLRAQFKNEWPKMEEVDAGEMGEFYPLFATVGNREAFREALVEYCDFRLARMHEYPSQHAKRRRNSLLSDGLTYGPSLLLPAELLAFSAIYERVTGMTCDLGADHLILSPAVIHPPIGLTLPENELTACVRETGSAVFGSAWQPGALVDVRFDDLPPDVTAQVS